MKTTRRKAKPGEVLFFYGQLPGDHPDHIGMWGGGTATKRHSNVIMSNFTQEKNWPYRLDKTPKSFLQELDEAGFDIKTLQFSIRMKQPKEEHEN